jgi:hypothetical protein
LNHLFVVAKDLHDQLDVIGLERALGYGEDQVLKEPFAISSQMSFRKSARRLQLYCKES